MTGSEAMRASQGYPPAVFLHHRGRNDSGRHGNDRIADQHHTGGDKTADRCHRGDVAIAHGRHRNDCPVDAVGDIIELRIGLRPFDHKHNRSDSSHENKHKQKENEYLPATHPQRNEQQVPFFQIIEHLKHAEHADQPEGSYNQQIACTGKEHAQIERQRSQQSGNVASRSTIPKKLKIYFRGLGEQ